MAEECLETGNYPQVVFDTERQEFSVHEHVDSGSYVPFGENDIYISIPEVEAGMPAQDGFSQEKVTEGIVSCLAKKGTLHQD